LAVVAAAATVASLGAATGGTPLALAGPAAAKPAAAKLVAASASAAVAVRPGVIPLKATPLSAPPTTAQCEAQLKIACYQPFQLRQAYGLPKLYAKGIDGAGQTIMIVDPFGSPTIGQDLATFDRSFHIPAPPSLKIIQPAGKVPPYQPTGTRINWAFETTLDVEYSHMVAPDANILLVETPISETEGTGGFPQIVKAEEFVIQHHLGDVISQSFGATEQSFATAQALLRLRTPYVQAAAAGITVLASTGDDGVANVHRFGNDFFLHPTINWPDSDPLVTAVGGTQLHLNAAGKRTDPDNVWNDTFNVNAQKIFEGNPGPNPLATGGGKSAIFLRPSYQAGVAGATGNRRGVPDISMSAACDGSVIIHVGFKGLPAGFTEVCGTSEAAPLFAGIVALADQAAGHPLGVINPALYVMLAHHNSGLVDVKEGNNTVSFSQGGKEHTITGFAAGPGYDLASGVGTIFAPDFVPALARTAG
jgi:subtilase family serine protease